MLFCKAANVKVPTMHCGCGMHYALTQYSKFSEIAVYELDDESIYKPVVYASVVSQDSAPTQRPSFLYTLMTSSRLL